MGMCRPNIDRTLMWPLPLLPNMCAHTQTCNLANADVSEEDKIQAMMTQSNHEYDPMK